MYVRHLQHLLHMAGSACKSQLSSYLFQLTGRHHDDPDTSAVNISHTGQVEDNLFPQLTRQAFDRPFQMLAIPADRDSSGYFQDNNVRLQLLGLNLEYKPGSFPIFERALNGTR
jgi:hypothetical protein